MSIDNKPHQGEPVLTSGPTTFTDAWYQYFVNMDVEVNTTLIQELTSVSYSQSNGAATLAAKAKYTDRKVAEASAIQGRLSPLRAETKALSKSLLGISESLIPLCHNSRRTPHDNKALPAVKNRGEQEAYALSISSSYQPARSSIIKAVSSLTITLPTSPKDMDCITVIHAATDGDEVSVTDGVGTDILTIPDTVLSYTYIKKLDEWIRGL